MKRRAILLLAALSVLVPLTAGCKRSGPPPNAAPMEARPGRTKITVGDARLWVEIADDEETRTRGLMFRRELPEDEGMLFVFEYPQPLSFWMKNTHLPLDIAFISPDYKIINIETMKPLDEKPRYLSQGMALYALEVNQGWFARHGVKRGTGLTFR
jgi:uncharacterized protein